MLPFLPTQNQNQVINQGANQSANQLSGTADKKQPISTENGSIELEQSQSLELTAAFEALLNQDTTASTEQPIIMATNVVQGEQSRQPITLFNPFVNNTAKVTQTTATDQDNPILETISNDPRLNKLFQQTAGQNETGAVALNSTNDLNTISSLMQATPDSKPVAKDESPLQHALVSETQQPSSLQKQVAEQSSQFSLAPEATKTEVESLGLNTQANQQLPGVTVENAQNNTGKSTTDLEVTGTVQTKTESSIQSSIQSGQEKQQLVEHAALQQADIIESAINNNQVAQAVTAQTPKPTNNTTQNDNPLKTKADKYASRYDEKAPDSQPIAAPNNNVSNVFSSAQPTLQNTVFNTTTVPVLDQTIVQNTVELPIEQTGLSTELTGELSLDSSLEENPFEWLESLQKQTATLTKSLLQKASFQHLNPQLQQPVQEQIAFQLKKAADSGVEQMRLQLSPASLGHVEMNMTIAADGTVQAVLAVERSDTYEWLRKDMASLEQMLAESGLDTQDGGLSLEYRDPQQHAEREQNNDWQLQEVVSVETAEAQLAPTYQPYISQTGVDVKV